jgi:type IV pilus assembly protein PilA
MKANLKQKLLLTLAKRKKSEGFTLIELLVVIIIIGILSALVLPDLLGQANKARQTEAKTNLGALIRGQQAYRLQEATFAGNLSALDVAVGGEFYNYAIPTTPAPDSTVVNIEATEASGFASDLRGYEAGAYQPAGGSFSSIICEDSDSTTDDADAPDATPGACAGGNAVN